MAEVLASYAVTVLVAWVLLARWLWHHLRLKAATGQVPGITREVWASKIHVRTFAAVMVVAVGFVVAFSWLSLVLAWVLIRVGYVVLHALEPEL